MDFVEGLECPLELSGAGAKVCGVVGRERHGLRLEREALFSPEIEQEKAASAAVFVAGDREEPREDFALGGKPMCVACCCEPGLLE